MISCNYELGFQETSSTSLASNTQELRQLVNITHHLTPPSTATMAMVAGVSSGGRQWWFLWCFREINNKEEGGKTYKIKRPAAQKHLDVFCPRLRSHQSHRKLMNHKGIRNHQELTPQSSLEIKI